MYRPIKTSRAWQRHMPQRSYRQKASYYDTGRTKKRIIKIIWGIFIILLIQSIFQASIFKLNNIEISGNQEIATTDIQNFANQELSKNKLLIFKNNNYFLFSSKDLEDKLINNFHLNEASVEKKFPHTVKIEVKEKISKFIWAKGDTLYLLDDKGALKGQILARDNKYLLIQDNRDQKPEGDQIFDQFEMDLLNNIILSWQDIIGASILVDKIVIDDHWALLDVYTSQGFAVKLDFAGDMRQQITNLQAIITQADFISEDIDYIDLRFGDKIFYK